MDKHLFLEIVRNGESDAKQAIEVVSLREQFPYSQLLHALSARLAKEHRLEEEQRSLQTAAVYAADRHVLKVVMNEDFHHAAASAEISQPAETDISPNVMAPEQKEMTVRSQNNALAAETVEPGTEPLVKHSKTFNPEPGVGPDVAERVMKDLRKLYDAKHNFEMMFTDEAQVSNVVGQAPVVKSEENITQKRKKRDQPHETILEEITIKKDVIEPESERQKEQIEIIDHFIKTQPTIANPKERQPAAANDLNSIKAGEFGDNIISETLVEILVKQGKKERAIEVLKKLIWKYPQKKAYFASQIEDLRK